MRRAFVVGFAAFDDSRIVDLPCAKNDAERFFKLITDDSLGGACADTSSLLISPTLSKLREQMGTFVRSLAADDEYVIFIAGHANVSPLGALMFDCRDTDPKSRALTAFGHRDLAALLSYRRGLRGILILDTCHAGSIADLARDEKARGALDNLTLDPAQEGQVFMYACGPSQIAIERNGAGLFSGLLCQAMEEGAGLGPDRAHVTADDAVRWVRAKLREAGLAERFRPASRTHGDVGRLFLCRNKHFGTGAPESEENSTSLVSELSRTIARLTGNIEHAREELERQASVLSTGASLTSREPFQVFRATGGRLAWNWIKFAVFGGGVGCLVAIAFFPEHPWLGVVLWIAMAALATLQANKVARDLDRHFLVVSPHGFCLAQGGSKRTLATWSEVRGLTRKTTNHNGWHTDGLEVTLATAASPLWLSDMELEPYASIDEVDEAFQRHIGLSSSLWFGPEFDSLPKEDHSSVAGTTLSRIGLVGVGSYRQLTSLAGPERDLHLLGETLVAAGMPSPDTASNLDFEAFKHWLGTFLGSAAGHVVMFYYSGHGLLAGDELVLAFSDTDPDRPLEKGFPVSKLAECVAEFDVQHLVVVLDCCFSGKAGDSLKLSSRAGDLMQILIEEKRTGVSVIAGSSDGQEALALSGKPSLFTQYLCMSLSETVSANRATTLNMVSEKLSEGLNAGGFDQRPWIFVDQDAGELVLASRSGNERGLDSIVQGVADQQSAALQYYLAGAGKMVSITGGDILDLTGVTTFECPAVPAGRWRPLDGLGCFAMLFLCMGFIPIMMSLVGQGNVVTHILSIAIIALSVGAASPSDPQPSRRLFIGPHGFVLSTKNSEGKWLRPKIGTRWPPEHAKYPQNSPPPLSWAIPANSISAYRVDTSHSNTNGDVTIKRSFVWIDNSGRSHFIAKSDERWGWKLDSMAEVGHRTLASAKLNTLMNVKSVADNPSRQL